MVKEKLKEGLKAEFSKNKEAERILDAPESSERSPTKLVSFSRPKSAINLNVHEYQAEYPKQTPDRRTSAFKSKSQQFKDHTVPYNCKNGNYNPSYGTTQQSTRRKFAMLTF
jgi:hypothetical protein